MHRRAAHDRSADDGVHVRQISYRVDSEVGRFQFRTHEIIEKEEVVYRSTEMLPLQRGKEYYLTQGFREVGMFMGATGASYRKTTERLNRLRRQEEGGTPLNTLRDATEAEGRRVLDFLENETERVLTSRGIDADHPPSKEQCANAAQLSSSCLWSTAEIEQAFLNAEIPESLRTEVMANPLPYERPEQSVNLCADGVVTKKQREKRRRKNEPKAEAERTEEKPGPKQGGAPNPKDAKLKALKRLNHKTATIAHDGKCYALVGATYVGLFRTILAFVLNNGLENLRLCFFTDGEKSLKNALVEAFAWHPAVVVILDWHHIEKKCAEFLSMSIKGMQLRNEHLAQVTKLLWYGAVESAVDYLKQIPPGQIKSQSTIDRLCGYFCDRRTMIPCYAIRKQLFLRNSSNPVEKANDQLVSSRQKHQGMSWSEEGSLALAALCAVTKNRHHRAWLQGHVIPFTFNPRSDEIDQTYSAKKAA